MCLGLELGLGVSALDRISKKDRIEHRICKFKRRGTFVIDRIEKVESNAIQMNAIRRQGTFVLGQKMLN
jgi:hypothetical protein